MDKATKLLIYGAAAHMLLSMMAMVIEYRKRKRDAMRVGITYGSSEALGTEDAETENDDGDVSAVPSPTDDNGASSSSATRPNKRAKVVDNEEARLIGAFKAGSERLAKAIEKAASDDLPPDLLQKLQSIPGFDDTHKASYFAYLVQNPRLGRVFPSLPLAYQISLLANFVSETFP